MAPWNKLVTDSAEGKLSYSTARLSPGCIIPLLPSLPESVILFDAVSFIFYKTRPLFDS